MCNYVRVSNLPTAKFTPPAMCCSKCFASFSWSSTFFVTLWKGAYSAGKWGSVLSVAAVAERVQQCGVSQGKGMSSFDDEAMDFGDDDDGVSTRFLNRKRLVRRLPKKTVHCRNLFQDF